MKTPISVNENGDVSTFDSVQDAERYMEPIDVENGEYIVTDAEGNRLLVEVVVREMPVLWGLWKSHVKTVRIVSASLRPKSD